MWGQHIKFCTLIMLNSIISFCESVACDLGTMVEVRDYSCYGWTGISFKTDKFGGVYVNLHIDNESCVITDWYGGKDACEVAFSALGEYVRGKMEAMLAERDLVSVYEAVNGEY